MNINKSKLLVTVKLKIAPHDVLISHDTIK